MGVRGGLGVLVREREGEEVTEAVGAAGVAETEEVSAEVGVEEGVRAALCVPPLAMVLVAQAQGVGLEVGECVPVREVLRDAVGHCDALPVPPRVVGLAVVLGEEEAVLAAGVALVQALLVGVAEPVVLGEGEGEAMAEAVAPRNVVGDTDCDAEAVGAAEMEALPLALVQAVAVTERVGAASVDVGEAEGQAEEVAAGLGEREKVPEGQEEGVRVRDTLTVGERLSLGQAVLEALKPREALRAGEGEGAGERVADAQ